MLSRLLLAFAPAADELSTLPRLALGFALGAGVAPDDGPAPTGTLLAPELRVRVRDSSTTIDVQVDVAHLALTGALSSRPRLRWDVFAHFRPARGRRAAFAVMPGVAGELGLDATVRDERLVRRPGAALGLAGRLGLDLAGRRRAFEFGLYLHGVIGAELIRPSAPFARVTLDFTLVWGLGGRS